MMIGENMETPKFDRKEFPPEERTELMRIEHLAAKDDRGWTARAVYELLRDGFDVVGLKRPPWWRFGTAGRTLTVCAGRKNWRNRGVPIVGATMPVSSAMLSPRARGRN